MGFGPVQFAVDVLRVLYRTRTFRAMGRLSMVLGPRRSMLEKRTYLIMTENTSESEQMPESQVRKLFSDFFAMKC